MSLLCQTEAWMSAKYARTRYRRWHVRGFLYVEQATSHRASIPGPTAPEPSGRATYCFPCNVAFGEPNSKLPGSPPLNGAPASL